MAVTINPVHALGTRVLKVREWTAIDKCGASVTPIAPNNPDTAKFKEVTFTNIGLGPCKIHVAVFSRASFTGSVITTEFNAPSIALFLQYSTEIPLGATLSLKDVYMDYMSFDCNDPTSEPIIAVWLDTVTGEKEDGYLDVIQRR